MSRTTATRTPDLEQTVTLPTEPSRITLPTPKPQRMLACVLCQQRKVKCDRKLPCSKCVRSGVQCVPASSLAPRQRRRRFAERELLDRIHNYERLLHQNDINFEPLHPSTPLFAAGPNTEHASHNELDRRSSGSPSTQEHLHLDTKVPRKKTAARPKDAAVDLWNAISKVTVVDSEDENQDHSGVAGNKNQHGLGRDDSVLENVWSHRFQSGSNDQETERFPVDLNKSHPEQVQIFRLWQIYLENVDPLLKVTHTPTLQPRIINAAGNMANISSSLEALIFSIYCVSVLSLSEGECRDMFHLSRNTLLDRYQSACQQALLRCHAWRSGDRDGLTAIYLYLLSVRSQTDPRSLSCMLAVAIRIAQRIGMHSESSYTGCTALEAEMRRRLWWSLVIFDHRICEMSDYKGTSLIPTWDCSTPLNVNDFELRPDIKQENSPVAHERPTEALFSVVRSELADFVRHSAFHINFVSPSLNAIARPMGARQGPFPEGGELVALEQFIEDKYLAKCDLDDPLHFMTIWTARSYLARNRLLEHYSSHSTSSVRPTDAQRSAALSHALSMLESDTKLRSSPLTRKFLWYTNSHFPALAYLHILIVIGKRPADDHAEKAWGAVSKNYEALITRAKQDTGDEQEGTGLFFLSYSRAIIQAWEAREELLRQQHKQPETPPRIVLDVRSGLGQMGSTLETSRGEQPDNGAMVTKNTENTAMPSIPMGLYSDPVTGSQSSVGTGPAGGCPDMLGQGTMDVDMGQYWTEIDWRWMHTQGW